MVPGAESLFFLVIAVAIGGYLLISGVVTAFVYFICPEPIKKWALAVVILILIAIPIDYLMIESYEDKEETALKTRVLAEYEAAKNQAHLLSDSYLQQVCDQESRLVVHKPLPAGADVLILANLQALSPTTKLAPDVVLTEKMLEQNNVTARSFPLLDIEEQYVTALDWFPEHNMESTVAKSQIRSVIYPGDQDEAQKDIFYRLARKSAWIQDGKRDFVIKEADSWRLDDFNKLSDNEFVFPIKVERQEEQYTIAIEDISTLKDREYWVARGKIELKDSGKVIAEYVGFQQLYFNNTVCGNIKKTTNVDPEKDVLSYFIEQISKNEISTDVKS